MTNRPSRPPRPAGAGLDRLGVRFALVLALALLPLGIVSIAQTSQLSGEARARSEAALMGKTLRAASAEVSTIRLAQGIAKALAVTVSDHIDDPVACSSLMAEIQKAEPRFSLVAYIPLSGKMECSSTGKTFDFKGNPLFDQMTAQPRPGFVVNPRGPISQTSVLVIAHPVFDRQGAHVGVVSLSLPHERLAIQKEETWQKDFASEGDEPIALTTFDARGNILTSTVGLEDAPNRLPRDWNIETMTSGGQMTFTAVSVLGYLRSFSVVPLAEGQLYLVGTWPLDNSNRILGLQLPPYLFPSLMWIASLLVAILVAERLVSRHVRALGRSIRDFAAGNRLVGDLDLSRSPAEIREVGEAYLKMTDTILHDEAELEDMVHQKEVLLREVHHRVKNNLQLIASIMNMQMRQARSPETKDLMKGLRERVMSLATIHRELYQTSGLTDVRADELFRSIVRQIVTMASGPGRRFEVDTRFDDLRLTPDQAVPLSLLLTEALTNALKYGSGDFGERPVLSVSLVRSGPTHAILEVVNSAVDDRPVASSDSTGLGSQLVQAFALQLSGQLETSVDDGLYALRVRFPVKSLAEAEDRNAAPEADEAATPEG